MKNAMFAVLVANAMLVGFFAGNGSYVLAAINVAAGLPNLYNCYVRMTN